jgi:hypothetical protein
MPNPLYTVDKLPATSAAAIREFDDRYIAGISAAPVPTWSNEYGEVSATNTPHTTYPISALGLKYQRTMGENRFKTLAEASFDLKVEEFDEGIEESLERLTSDTFASRKWNDGPARLLNAEQRLVSRTLALLIEAGETTDSLWENPDGSVEFFDTAHPANFADSSKGTWSNLATGTTDVVSISNIETQVTAMQTQVLDEQGEKIPADPDVILVPTAKYEPLKNLLAVNLLLDSTGVAGVESPYQGKFTVVHVPEFTDANDWYLVDSKMLAMSLPPWIALRYVPSDSLGLRRYDESSDFFKDTGNIKVSSHVWWGFSLAFPHAIRKVPGA